MINLYYALKYPDGRLVSIGKNQRPVPTEHISFAWLKEAKESSLPEMEMFQKHFDMRVTIVVIKISELAI